MSSSRGCDLPRGRGGRRLSSCQVTVQLFGSLAGSQLIQQRGSIFQVSSGAPLRKPLTDRCDECTGFLALAPCVKKPPEARGGSQLPRPSLLAASDFEGLPEGRLGGSRGVFCRADEQQLAFDAVQFGLEVQLSCGARDGEALFDSRQCVFGTVRLR